MSEAWAAIIAAIAAGVFGIGGVFAGIIVGRRQATDQAHVEHGHWLREQRLQSFTQLYTVWDEVMQDLEAFQERWPEEVESYQEHGGELHLSVIAGRMADEAWARLRPAIERAELLGPMAIYESLKTLQDAWRETHHVLRDQACAEPYDTLPERWQAAQVTGQLGRVNFHVAASAVLPTPPTPKGEPLL